MFTTKTAKQIERDRETASHIQIPLNLDLGFNHLHLLFQSKLAVIPNSAMDCCTSVIKVLGITVGIIPTSLGETHMVRSYKLPQLRPHLVEHMSPASLTVATQN